MLSTRELAALARSVAGVVREHVSEALAPLAAKFAELETRVASIPAGKDGRDGVDGKDGLAGVNGKDGHDGIDGKDGAPGDRGTDGKDGRDGIDGKDGAPGRDGIDGKDGALGERGADGKDGRDGVDGKDGAPGRDGIDGKDGASGQRGIDGKDGRDGIDGKDGVPGARGLDGKDGIPGRDGKDGRDGVDGKSVSIDDVKEFCDQQIAKHVEFYVNKWALDFERRAQDVLQRAIERIEKPKDGINGKDGLGFDDMTVEHDGLRKFTLRFARGEQTKESSFELPVVLDKGVYRANTEYETGDAVSFDGCLWIAQKDTSARPRESTDWRLAVKKGRDGRDAEKPVASKDPVRLG